VRRRRKNPADAWWIFGVVAGAGALVAGVAYAASGTPAASSTPTPTGGNSYGPTTPTSNSYGPTPTATPAADPPTQLVQGQSYKLDVSCTAAVAQPDASSYPFLAGATILSYTPATHAGATSTTWVVNFTYNGATMAAPTMPSGNGCTATLHPYTNPAI